MKKTNYKKERGEWRERRGEKNEAKGVDMNRNSNRPLNVFFPHHALSKEIFAQQFFPSHLDQGAGRFSGLNSYGGKKKGALKRVLKARKRGRGRKRIVSLKIRGGGGGGTLRSSGEKGHRRTSIVGKKYSHKVKRGGGASAARSRRKRS